jgi:allophanate hydrolase
VLNVVAVYDPEDPWSRRVPVPPPSGVARTMCVVGIPSGPLDLDAEHRGAWHATLDRAKAEVRLVPVDISALLEAAQLLYRGPFVAERFAAFGKLLLAESPDLDPVVREIVLSARALRADQVFTAQHRLKQLRRDVETIFADVDAILLPTTPCHPTLAEVAADPIGVNHRLGTYTNMVNLLDLCAVALPMATRSDGLPFGVQLLAPAFADKPLLELSALLLGEPTADPLVLGSERSLLAVCGAHMAGQPLAPLFIQHGAGVDQDGNIFRARVCAEFFHNLDSAEPRQAEIKNDDFRQMFRGKLHASPALRGSKNSESLLQQCLGQ